MLLSALGSIAFGLVWGWLIGSLEGRVHQPHRTVPLVILATSAVLAEVFLVAQWRGLVSFTGAMLFALLIHIGWRRELRNRLEALSSK